MRQYAYLVMQDGRVFRGKPFGALGDTSGEVVFNTSMMGYQEILTDPSYAGQIITMTYPLIGNYGVNEEDTESREIFADGFIVKEESHIASSFRSHGSLGDYLRHHNVVGIQGIDTRALTRHIRERGAMPGVISSVCDDIDQLKERAGALQGTEGVDLVSKVTYDDSYEWNGQLWDLKNGFDHKGNSASHRVVAIDLGVKQNILRHLKGISASVMVVPATAPLEEILRLDPDGIFLSNGPGDPSAAKYVADKMKALIGQVPIFGICLGHQLLCMALGAKTYKLKFGHHGGNQPVKDLKTGKVEITSQNHNYAIDSDTLPQGVDVTHINLNDNTVEGIEYKEKKLFSVQYHPEASPGPHDAKYLFDRFSKLMDEGA